MAILRTDCELIGTVNILGSEWHIYHTEPTVEPALESASGTTDFTAREIHVEKIIERTPDMVRDLTEYRNHVIRHELVHAFLYESGLGSNSNEKWAMNEEMVDWIAFQWPKMVGVMEAWTTT